MDFLTFLHLHDIAQTWPQDLFVVLVLVILEGLLSCDNAVVLALLVKHLPPEQRGRALRYGIIGAYVFRIIALLLAVWIMQQWYLKVLGGLYLVWLGASHFLKKADEEAEEESVAKAPMRRFGLSVFWSTVIAVELTDIVFSVDSIAAAVALTDKLWVLIIGALAGILVMRFAAQGFVRLLELFPKLEACAFVAVLFIGIKLLFEFPGDVAGLRHAFPDGTTYPTAKAYHEAVEKHCPPWLSLHHVATINTAAAPQPEAHYFTGESALIAAIDSKPAEERAKLIAEVESALNSRLPAHLTVAGVAAEIHAEDFREFQKARSDWNLHLRPLIEIEGWVSSLVVILIFALGFRRKS